ncbi:MAG: H-NS family nucleoid-associated regulatory protein [Microgenomates group bacterium]|jgi:DNA-binding protein H-NS
MSLDLEKYSFKELKEIQSQVAKAISSFEDRKRKQALVEIEDRAKALGFTLAELTGLAGTRKRSPAVAKYANPDDSTDTWSGRGRKPRWFAAALASGKKPEDFAI